MGKQRLDNALVERCLAPTRAKAQAFVLAGIVFGGGVRLDKPGHAVPPELEIEVRGGDGWVSRGAHKLIAGLDAFAVDARAKVALDIGAATGGFTQALLRRGARRVYAIDVGHGQLDWSLRNHPLVTVLERVNARFLDATLIGEPIDLVVCDVSFISLRLVLPAALALAAPGAELVALIKPQFEAGRAQVGKGGVVRDPAVHAAVQAAIAAWLKDTAGWQVLGTAESPILGPAGNREFLIGARKPRAAGPGLLPDRG